MPDCIIKPLKLRDARAVADLLRCSSRTYTRFFHPFPFDEKSITQVLERAGEDQFFGLFVTQGNRNELVGFSMLRGFNEGYTIPMYGVFVSEKHAGLGLARCSLQHAETFCRLNKIPELKLKVHPNNARAKALYEACGFEIVGEDQANANFVLRKKLEPKSRQNRTKRSKH
ncbi:MAG TPA: GNAT family N-acetyltransferase [Chthoniobacterales bacterium]|jgi:ribosomal protein S18 acetylase RimI-like enzyme|nr:GNAT family N-acetyltransferase [Chthoniobacterales bacterium]